MGDGTHCSEILQQSTGRQITPAMTEAAVINAIYGTFRWHTIQFLKHSNGTAWQLVEITVRMSSCSMTCDTPAMILHPPPPYFMELQ